MKGGGLPAARRQAIQMAVQRRPSPHAKLASLRPHHTSITSASRIGNRGGTAIDRPAPFGAAGRQGIGGHAAVGEASGAGGRCIVPRMRWEGVEVAHKEVMRRCTPLPSPCNLAVYFAAS